MWLTLETDIYDIMMTRLPAAWISKEEFFKEDFSMKHAC